MSHRAEQYHSDTDISVNKRKNWVKSVTNSLFRNKLKRKAQQDDTDSKAAKVDQDFEDVDKENEPVLNSGVSIHVKSFDDALNEDDDSDSERGPNPEDIVLNMDSLLKYQKIIDPDFDLNEVESRERLDSHAAYDRAMVGRAQQRRLPGKVANVTQSRPTLVVTHTETYGRSQSFGGRQLSSSPMLDAEEQRMALTPDERQKQIISKLKEQSSNPLAGLARALKHGPRRSFGKSRHTEADPTPPKVAPVTKPKPKPSSKGGSDEKEEKTGGFLFRRRSFNEKKTTTTTDDDSYKGSPKVSKKFGIKLGGSGSKKPVVKSKPIFSSTSSAGENDSILSEDIPQANNTTSTPSKTFVPTKTESPSTQKTSTPYKEDSTPPSRRERTPNERDSALFKDPPPLFGHRSVLFGSAEFDAIFEKFSKEEEESSKASEPADDSSEIKQSNRKSATPDRKPTPAKKPEVSSKPNWSGRGSTSSDKPSEQKSGGSRVSEGRALFEKPKSAEESTSKMAPSRKGFGGVFSKYEDNAQKKVEDEITKSKDEEKTGEDKKMEITKEEEHTSSTKHPLFDDDQKVEAMETDEKPVETKVDTKKSLFDKYKDESATTNLFKDEDDDDDDKLFGGKDTKQTSDSTKKSIYGPLFSTEEKTTPVQRSGSLFDEEPSDDELFSTKKPQKKDDSVKGLDFSKPSDTTTVVDRKAKEAKVSSVSTDEDESPLFGRQKSPSPDLFSKEKEEKDKESIEDDILMDTDKEKNESVAKNEKEPGSPGLFDKPSSPLFEDKSEVQRSTSIFEVKRSKSEEELFQIEQKEKDSEVKETDVAGGFLLVDVEKKKDEATRSSLFDDKLLFDDSNVLPKLEKESKEKKSLFAIDDFVMVPKQEEITAESVTVEHTTTDPLRDEKKEKVSELALEEFPPKQSATEDEAQEETIKESAKEKQSSEKVPTDSDRSRIRHGSTEKKRNTSLKEEKKSSDDDRPVWMIEAQRRKERRLLEKEKEKEKKLLGTKEKSPTTRRHVTDQSKPPLVDVKLKKPTNNSAASTSVTKKPVVEDDMPEWQKKLMERKQRVAEQKKAILSSSSRETTYTSRRDRNKGTDTVTATASSSVEDKKKEVEKIEDSKVEEKEQKETEEQKEIEEQKETEKQKETEEQPTNKTADKEDEKADSVPLSPLPEKPPLSPKPKLDEVKSPTRTTSVSSSKPELKKKPSVEVTISSTKRETRRSTTEQEKDKDRSKESPAKELENESSPVSKRRVMSSSDKKTASVSSKVTTSTRSSSTSSDSSVPKWKRDLQQQQKKAEPEKKDKGGRDTETSSTSEDGIPEWKRQLLEKRKQRRTPTPTDDKELPSASSKTDKQSSDKPNYRSVLTARSTPVALSASPKTTRKNKTVNKEVPEFMKEFKSKGRSTRDSKS